MPNDWSAVRFARQDESALALEYALAARDPEFCADNEGVLADFAPLDREIEEMVVRP